MSKQKSGIVFEKRIAERLHARHIKRDNYGVSAPDIEHPEFIGEAKLRATLALEGWVRQVEAHKDGRTCVVIAKQKNRGDDKAIVCMRLPDFQDLIEGKRGKWFT